MREKKKEKNPSRERKLASKNNLLEFRIFFFFSMKKKKVSVDAFVDQIGYWNYKIMYICEMCTPLLSLPPLKWKMLTAQTLLNILQYENSAYGRQWISQRVQIVAPIPWKEKEEEKFHMSHVTCHLSHATCHMLHFTCHMLPVTCHLRQQPQPKTLPSPC